MYVYYDTFAIRHTMIVARKRASDGKSAQERVATKSNGVSPVSGTRQLGSCPSSRNFATATSQPDWQAAWKNSLICVRGCRTASSSASVHPSESRDSTSPTSPPTRARRAMHNSNTNARACVDERYRSILAQQREALLCARGAGYICCCIMLHRDQYYEIIDIPRI
uniref:Uncharacterized protein n=1 Tax=Trichogramma kaykai TaxID=54128 RepID=A0ABD2XDH7_9HYME